MSRLSLNGSGSSNRKPTIAKWDREANEALATRYDALNQALTEAEQLLKLLKPLYPVWVDYDHNCCDGQPERWELLGLTKHQGKWRLCHASDDEINDDSPFHEIKPIVECPIDIRVRAAKVVRQLHTMIVKSKEDYIPKVDEAIKELNELCEEI